MSCIITRSKRHIKTTPIIAGEYFNNEVSKKSAFQVANKSDYPINHYMNLHEHENQGSMAQLKIIVQGAFPT